MKDLSRFLGLILRHKPEVIGLTIDRYGWADTDELIKKLNEHGNPCTFEDLEKAVNVKGKKRYRFNEDMSKVKADQGHSFDIDLDLPNTQPPETLLHGTVEKVVHLILESGLKKMARHHVHLSVDLETAEEVAGRRKTDNVIFEVRALEMYNDGHEFFITENGVWLTDHVPSKYLKIIKQ